MTDYIQEMMKTAGVKKQIMCEWTCKGSGLCSSFCEHYKTNQKVYPPFTPEKQLEIIKLIGIKRGFKVIPNEGYDYILSEDTYADSKYNKQGYNMTDFAQALAQLTNELMMSNEIDKEKVRRILGG